MKSLKKKKIFVVDDDPFWTAMLAQVLTGLEYTNIVTLENGTQCISNLSQNPALVFLDYQMEDMNGLQVLEQIKEYNPGIGVIFCTAHEDLGVAMDAMQQGSFDYLLKSNANAKTVAAIIEEMSRQDLFSDKIF
jgi:DNA-binding NtrC family response regulator